MILLTMGTYPLAFDRMIRAVDELVCRGLVQEEIFAQIGFSKYIPQHLKYERIMDKDVFDRCLKTASALIGHAGMGTITLALENDKPLLVMPRMKKYGEHVNDHQLHTARKFEQLGHILAAYDVDELPEKIRQLKDFKPAPRVSQAEKVARRIAEFLDGLRS